MPAVKNLHATLLIYFLFSSSGLFAQIPFNKPLISKGITIQSPIPYLILPSPDTKKALIEDDLSNNRKDKPFRFGLPIDVSIDVQGESEKIVLQDNSTISRFGLYCPGAKSINLIFSDFQLPKSAWMFIYDPQKSSILGAFTTENQSQEHQFATTFLFSDSLVIEIYDPLGSGNGKVVISQVIYGYRDLDQMAQFGSSGSCNINVACPEGKTWKNQSRSVVLLIAGGSNNYLCSGSLVNNVREDGTPYLLTADHCPVAVNNVAVFNYQSPDCSPSVDSSYAHSVNGLSFVARRSQSDFLLTKLSSKPPLSFNPFYAGWDNTGDIPLTTTCIHHPKGDVKKISFNFKNAVSSGYYTSGSDHWKVPFWDMGTTEVISSGSPLFNENKLIVGQLHGGDASCQSPEEEDYYGKFSYSWNQTSDSSRQLKHWLDPDQSGASVLYGYDPLVPKSEYDLSVLGFSGINSSVCGSDSIQPSVIIRNRGNKTLNQIKIEYSVNNIIIKTDVVNSTFPPGQIFTHIPGFIKLNPGFYTLKAVVSMPGFTDVQPYNNSIQTGISIVENSKLVAFLLQTDNDGNETSWELKSSTGSLLYGGGGYPSQAGGQLIRDTFCLDDGCFNFTIFDDYGDGICCGFGSGYYVLTNITTGDTLVKNYVFSSSDTSHTFCLGDSCGIRARAIIKGSSTSTSADGLIDLEMLSGVPPFIYFWSNGESTATVYNLAPGPYWVFIEDSISCTDSLFFEVGIGSSVLSLQDNSDHIIIYPNPADGYITITGLTSGPLYHFTISDVHGKMLKQIDKQADGKTEIDLTGLSTGLYFLTIRENFHTTTKRFVISR